MATRQYRCEANKVDSIDHEFFSDHHAFFEMRERIVDECAGIDGGGPTLHAYRFISRDMDAHARWNPAGDWETFSY